MTKELARYFFSGIRRFFSGIILSRISGLGRDLIMAYAFGDHPAVAAFLIAFRFSHVLRRFFGEGPLQSAFIPHFEGLKSKDQRIAYTFFRELTKWLSVVVLLIVVVCELGLGSILQFLSHDNREIVQLTIWIFPCLIFICLYGFNISFLQCHNVFFIPSVAPFLCNVIWIFGALYLRERVASEAMPILAKWVVCGFIVQWIITVPQVYHLIHGKARILLIRKEMIKLSKTFGVSALGVGAVQINSFLDVIFARCICSSGPVYLWYANRFQQLVLAILGISAVNTLVPVLSRAIRRGEVEKGKGIFSFGCRNIITMMLPMTLAVYMLGFAAIDLVFGRGSFSFYAVSQTDKCLKAYSLGLLPATLVMLQSAVLYATGVFHIPMLFSFVTVGANIGLNILFVFVFHLGVASTALATSIGAWCNSLLLYRALLKQGWHMGYSFQSFAHLLLATALASITVFFIEGPLKQLFLSKVFLFIIPGCLFIGILALYAGLFKKRGVKELVQ